MHLVENMFQRFSNDWRIQNEKFFGISPRSWLNMTIEESNKELAKDAEAFWNGDDPANRCEMANKTIDQSICHHDGYLVPNSFFLKRNHVNDCIEVHASFKNPKRGIDEERIVMMLPAPDPELEWIINGVKYTPRISAEKDYTQIHRDATRPIVYLSRQWTYNLETGVLDEHEPAKNAEKVPAFQTLSPRSIALLKAVNHVSEVTEDNWLSLLKKVPVFERNSIYNYRFSHLDMFFGLLKTGKTFANPTKGIPLDVPSIFMRQNSMESVSNKLISAKSTIFSLENYRTVVYRSAKYNSTFSFTDCVNWFDAFKTSTSADAGRHRLLLDNVTVHDGMLWVRDNAGREHDMFQVMASGKEPKVGISTISTSLFGGNNDAKRIMMTAKLSSQSVPTEGQVDPFTNRTPARVVFGDFEGYSYADSMIISESFAKKLTSHVTNVVNIASKDCEIFDELKVRLAAGETNLGEEDMLELMPTTNPMVIRNYSESNVIGYEMIGEKRMKLIIDSVIPFGYGDKITNLHGSKGVVGLILPDDEMPRLKNDIGDFKAGPFDIIISGFSVIRRNSMGQIFEAWARASGIEFEPGEDFIVNAVKKYKNEIADFCSKSVVEFNGEESIKPCGIVDIIRLLHHASTKISLSYIKSNSGKMLKLGEQEKLNLAANGMFKTMRELSIRSMHKWENSYELIYELSKSRRLPSEIYPNLMFTRLLDSIGFDVGVYKDGTRLRNKVPTLYPKDMDNYVASNTRVNLDEMFTAEPAPKPPVKKGMSVAMDKPKRSKDEEDED